MTKISSIRMMTSKIHYCRRRLLLWLLLCCSSCVGVTDGWWGQKPEFGPAESTVTVQEGETAKLPCVVLHLNDKSVTWLRRRDLHILTAGFHTYSADQRFQVVHAEGSAEWTLVVRYSQLRDAGVYECQVNTEPKLSRHVTLRVHDPRQVVSKTKVFVANNTASTKDGNLRVEILGPRELYIEEGSSLSLTCLVTSLRGPSALVYWYHDTSIIDYNSPRGGVNLKIDRGRGETTTRLVVSSVGPGDSGMYSCVPQGSHPATVLVHVQKGEHEAAIQQGGLSSAPSPASSISLFLICLFLPLLCLSLLPSTFTSDLDPLHLLCSLAFNSTFTILASILTFDSPINLSRMKRNKMLMLCYHTFLSFASYVFPHLEFLKTPPSSSSPVSSPMLSDRRQKFLSCKFVSSWSSSRAAANVPSSRFQDESGRRSRPSPLYSET